MVEIDGSQRFGGLATADDSPGDPGESSASRARADLAEVGAGPADRQVHRQFCTEGLRIRAVLSGWVAHFSRLAAVRRRARRGRHHHAGNRPERADHRRHHGGADRRARLVCRGAFAPHLILLRDSTWHFDGLALNDCGPDSWILLAADHHADTAVAYRLFMYRGTETRIDGMGKVPRVWDARFTTSYWVSNVPTFDPIKPLPR